MEQQTLKQNLDELQKLAKERTVKTQNIEYDLETLVKKIKNGIIKLNPEYQRNHRWDNKTSSKLIESLILNIPIPTIYISQDIDVDEEVDKDISRYSVIDGQQRLTAIYDFMNNSYALEELEVLEPLNGSYYKDLPPFLIRRLEERTIKCLRIDSTLDSQVKYDIFERLNSGSVELTSQELRNAIYRGPFNALIKELAKNKVFLKLMNIDENASDENNRVKKMEDVECVLRFFSFDNGRFNEMKKSFKKHLSEQMELLNEKSPEELDDMRTHFLEVMNTIDSRFPKYPFAKYKVESSELKITSKFNNSVFDALSISVSMNMTEGILKIDPTTIDNYYKLFFDEKFNASISGSTNDKSKIVYRIERVRGVLR